MHEFCIEWAQKPPQIRREHLPDRQASVPRPRAEGEHRKYPQSPARRGWLQNGRFATYQSLHGASDKECFVIIPTFLCSWSIDLSRAYRVHKRQLLIAAKKKKKDCSPVWEPKNSCMHLHCFVGSEDKTHHLGVQIDCVICIWSVESCGWFGLILKLPELQDYLGGCAWS